MEQTKFTTKSGKEIVIRPASPGDAEALLQMKLEYLENSKTIPLFKNEYPDKVEQECELIERINKERNSTLLVAEHNGKLVGNIDLNGNQRLKLFHTGVIGMGIRETWRGIGVGSALLHSIIQWSKNNPFLTILWLEVYETNSGGKALYEKMGFEECGRIKGFFQEEEGNIDKLTMVRHL